MLVGATLLFALSSSSVRGQEPAFETQPVEPVEPVEPRPSRGRILRPPFSVRALVLLDLGVLPKLAAGPALLIGVRLQRTALELGIAYLPTQSLSADGRDGSVGQLRFLAGSIGACYAALKVGRLELGPCARVEYGRIWGRGQNLDEDTYSGGASWLALLAGARASLQLSELLSVGLELGAGVPLLEPSFSVSGLGEVHATESVVGRLSAGAELRF